MRIIWNKYIIISNFKIYFNNNLYEKNKKKLNLITLILDVILYQHNLSSGKEFIDWALFCLHNYKDDSTYYTYYFFWHFEDIVKPKIIKFTNEISIYALNKEKIYIETYNLKPCEYYIAINFYLSINNETLRDKSLFEKMYENGPLTYHNLKRLEKEKIKKDEEESFFGSKYTRKAIKMTLKNNHFIKVKNAYVVPNLVKVENKKEIELTNVIWSK